jgi:anhydro-N-acetylmuramic acid kinase
MSGSSLDGLDIVFAEFTEQGGAWTFEILASDCYAYSPQWAARLKEATTLNALDYQLLHTDYGHYLGSEVNRFIEANGLHYKVGLVASHGHTTFHVPSRKMTAQLGDGAAIAAETGLPVVSDLRALDVAFGGQGAPIVPIGEKLLLKDYSLYLASPTFPLTPAGNTRRMIFVRPTGYSTCWCSHWAKNMTKVETGPGPAL